MTEYLLKLGIGGESFYKANSGEVAANRAVHLAKEYNTTVRVYKPYFTAELKPRDDESLAEQHLNDIIEEPSRTIKAKTQTEPKLYDELMRKFEFMGLFYNAKHLFNTSSLFRDVVDEVSKGKPVHNVLVDFILLVEKLQEQQLINIRTDNETK